MNLFTTPVFSRVSNVVTKVADYTATNSDDLILVDLTGVGADKTVTLPDPVANPGKALTIKKIDSTLSKAIVAGGIYSIQRTIDGANTVELLYQNDFITVVSNGTHWNTVAKKFRPIYVKAEITSTSANLGLSSAPEVLDYNSIIEDSHGLITTGASWKFTAPRDMICQVFAQWLTGTTIDTIYAIRIAIDGTVSTVGDYVTANLDAVSSSITTTLSLSVKLNKGSYLDIRGFVGSGTATISNSGTSLGVYNTFTLAEVLL